MRPLRAKTMGITLVVATVIPLALGGLGVHLVDGSASGSDDLLLHHQAPLKRMDRTLETLRRQLAESELTAAWDQYVQPGAGTDSPSLAEVLPATNAPAPLFDLLLSGIVWRRGRLHAYVNDRLVTSGDEVDGFRVVDIARNRVTFQGDDGSLYLSYIDEDLRSTYPAYFEQ